MDERQTEDEEIRRRSRAAAAAPTQRRPTALARPARTRSGQSGGEWAGRRRVCIMCADHIRVVDYKNVSFLRRFVSERGRIETRRKTSACAKHQRALASAIKRARHLALIPYTAGHVRGMSTGHR